VVSAPSDWRPPRAFLAPNDGELPQHPRPGHYIQSFRVRGGKEELGTYTSLTIAKTPANCIKPPTNKVSSPHAIKPSSE